MSRWPTEKDFASWLALSPANKISGGKVLSSRTKASANRVAAVLHIAASSLHHSRSALGAFFRRLKARLVAPKAITATARKLACLIYNMLKHGTEYVDQGQRYYEQRYTGRVLANLSRRAHELGTGWSKTPNRQPRPHSGAQVTRELYVPQDWCADAERRDAVGLPAALRFREKWRIAVAQVHRLRQAGFRFEAVLADADYGTNAAFRRALERLGLRYGVAIRGNLRI